MESWTVRESHGARYRLMINHGGQSYWCMFDYLVSPTPGNGQTEIELSADADAVSIKWFPHLRNGMLRGLVEERERGRELVGTRIEVQKVYEHSVDTTARGCETYGFNFVIDLMSGKAVPVVA